MKYQDLLDKVGMRFDIVEGELRESPDGLFLCSFEYQPYTIYLNKLTREFSIIAPENSYLGRSYKIKQRDCVTLVKEWIDNKFGTNFKDIYLNISNKEYFRYYRSGLKLWYEENNFKSVESLKEGDCLIYAYKPAVISHIGVYLENDKILHHMPQTLSCIDTIDYSKLIGAYRYA